MLVRWSGGFCGVGLGVSSSRAYLVVVHVCEPEKGCGGPMGLTL